MCPAARFAVVLIGVDYYQYPDESIITQALTEIQGPDDNYGPADVLISVAFRCL